MAGDLEELDSVVTLVVLLAIVGGVGYLVYLLWPLIKTLLAGGKGGKSGLSPSETQSVFQSLKNAMDGFPDGADPGGVPAFQYAQGIVESIRHIPNFTFGAGNDDYDFRTNPDTLFGDDPNGTDLGPDDIPYLFPEGSTAETAPLPAPTSAQIAGAQSAVNGFDQWASSPGNVEGDVTDWFINNVF